MDLNPDQIPMPSNTSEDSFLLFLERLEIRVSRYFVSYNVGFARMLYSCALHIAARCPNLEMVCRWNSLVTFLLHWGTWLNMFSLNHIVPSRQSREIVSESIMKSEQNITHPEIVPRHLHKFLICCLRLAYIDIHGGEGLAA